MRSSILIFRKQKLDQKTASLDAEEGKHKAALLLSVESTSRAERDKATAKWETRIRTRLEEAESQKVRVAKDLNRYDLNSFSYFFPLLLSSLKS